MARSNIKENQNRCRFQSFELIQKVLKGFIFNRKLSQPVRRKFLWQHSRLCFLYSFVFLKNRCILTGRCRSVYSYFNLSRLAIKEFFSSGVLPHMFKSSW